MANVKITPSAMASALAQSVRKNLKALDHTSEKGRIHIPLTDENRTKLPSHFRDTFEWAQKKETALNDKTLDRYVKFEPSWEGSADLERLFANRERALAQYRARIVAPARKEARSYGGVIENGSQERLDTDRINDPLVYLPDARGIDLDHYAAAYETRVTAALNQAFQDAGFAQTPVTTTADMEKVVAHLPAEFQDEARALSAWWVKDGTITQS